ncbi:FecR family protein [Mucilaginibacter limnophilus]|uniref:FecR family protein n=1 Tax=Mucilaginibacter limnophilus TaxID=1932778 RepID=A0A3S2WYN0_9SPHI|nr:FecR family protein [Mucilaginibacter limnophilus]RVU01214.1 FecR family protein [Mucilaginibacter limnophilus]
MKETQLSVLIDKYLSGSCTPEEARVIEGWYDALQPEQRNFFDGQEKAINASAERSLRAIREKLQMGDDSYTAQISQIRPVRRQWQWLAAACILVLISVGGMLLMKRNAAEHYVVLSAATGQIKGFQLPDGTRVLLNAGSQLKYCADYNEKKRRVWLDGEAFFDVKHDKQKPFDVEAGDFKTHVLGTAFAVSAYPGALVKTVTVTRGKVQVSNTKKVLGLLLPDRSLEYTENTGITRLRGVDAGKMVSWTAGKLAFIDMPMQDIAIHLQRWYGVKFIFNDQHLKNTRFTASFNGNIPLQELLLIMSEVSHVNYRYDAKNRIVTCL